MNLCDTMCNMETRRFFIVRNILISILFTLACVSAILFSTNAFAHAQTPTQLSIKQVLPNSNLEYYELSSPIDVYSDESVTAILQEQKLIVYKDGDFKVVENDALNQLVSVKQIKKMSNDTLLISSDGALRMVSLQDYSISPLQFNGVSISGTYFDLNSNYLVKTFGNTNIMIYSLNGTTVTDNLAIQIDHLNGDSPVAINSNNQIFYVTTNGLYMRDLNNLTQTQAQFLADVTPTRMIANDSYVYFLEDKNVYQLSINGAINDNEQPIKLSVTQDDKHQLGNVSSPNSIAFKGQDLLLTDFDLNSVQQFTLNENKLEFTGFAIAKGKTAFNRISSSVKKIDRYANTLAILDQNKLSIINVNDTFNTYSKTNFAHFFSEDLQSIPDTFALGNGYCLLVYGLNSSTSTLKLLNLSNRELVEDLTMFSGNIVRDVCYQSETFYILADNGNGVSEVYKLDIATNQFTNVLTDTGVYGERIAVDVYGNVYLSQDQIYKFNKQDFGFSGATTLPNLSRVKQLSTDLGGGLFALTDNAINYLDKNNQWQEITINKQVENGVIQSFAMSFDRQEVYFVYQNEELVYSINGLPNLSIDAITIPNEYKVTDKNANAQDFKAYTTGQGANAYAIKIDGQNFKFDYLVNDVKHYAFICPITISDSFDRTLNMYALVGQDEIVVIDSSLAVDVTPAQNQEVSQKAFVTTPVHAYYLPIISPTDDYVLTDATAIRLEKNAPISPISKFSFLDKEYYFASFIINQTTYTGYIPIDFTVEVLSQDFTYDSYTIEKVAQTKVYKEDTLETEIAQLELNTSVRLIETKNGISKIAFNTEHGWSIGYVNSYVILNQPSVAVRNILIIILVLASVCGTTTFFVLRKKS